MLRSVRRALGDVPAAQFAYRCVVDGRLRAERWALAARTSTAGHKRARILAYHSIGTPEWEVNDVSPRHFESHLQMAVDDGWTFATPAQVLARPEEQLLALTFDDGCTSVLDHAAPVLRHHGIPSTMFVVTGWADGGHEEGYDHVLDWHGLVALQDQGMTLASHSVTHRDFGKLRPDEARRELEVSRERMVRMLDVDTDEFAIPFGQSKNWTDAATLEAKRAGYSTVYAQSVETRPAGTVPRTFITAIDRPPIFRAALAGAYDRWEEWYLSGPVDEEPPTP
ncbi:polysaccharide deacetylase family protein [Pseudonocardia sp. 73-21]|uniref:polysaccharide deacetylase family protein n=1 Tax=Pseudonocardia sp. 73-21 TaxID=1895809 RepID=UPI002634AD5C|nr:polysaccharide deacetylase family protein [Pseudonocardia sp. 73-21]